MKNFNVSCSFQHFNVSFSIQIVSNLSLPNTFCIDMKSMAQNNMYCYSKDTKLFLSNWIAKKFDINDKRVQKKTISFIEYRNEAWLAIN